MKIIKLDKLLPDNRVVKFHRVESIDFSEQPGIMMVKIASFEYIEQSLVAGLPAWTFIIQMTYNDMMTAHENLVERIIETEDWIQSEVLEY